MRKTKLAFLSTSYVCVLAVAGGLMLAVATAIYRDVETIDAVWSDFIASRDDKALALASIRREMGYGGMIHAFKTFLFRGDEVNLERARQSIGGARSAIDLYKSFGTTEVEVQALAAIEAVISQYEDAIETAAWLYPETLSAVALDREVAIDDSAALAALKTLDELVFGGLNREGGGTKAGLLNRIRSLLGYGGLVHRFHNYILRGDEAYLEAVGEEIANIRQIVVDYEKLASVDGEKEALTDLLAVLSAYEKNSALADSLLETGAVPRSVERATRVIDDRAFDSLIVLTRAIVADNQRSAANLTKAIQNIRSFVYVKVALVVGLIGLLAAFTIWLLRYRVVRPVTTITEEMRALAEGDLIPPAAGKDTVHEIAEMHAALDVFRENEIERRQANIDLENREQLFQALVASTPDATIIVDRDGTIQIASNQTEAIFGYTRSELVGEKVELLVPDAVKRGHVARRDGFINNHTTRPMGGNLSLFGKRKNGDVFPVEVSLSPIETSMGLLVAAAVRDITDRKENERRLESAYEIITESIDYAANIQQSLLPHEDSFTAIFEDHFILWEPRDKVGGDIYWARIWGDGLFFGLVDCTGHGVPGAFMTLIATGALERALDDVVPGEVGKLIQRLHQLIQLQLGQNDGSSRGGDDGLEMGAVYLDADLANVNFAGARFSLFVNRKDAVEEVKGTKAGIGYRATPFTQHFDQQVVTIAEGDEFFMTSDGLIDQIGGERKRSFGKKRFKQFLTDIHGLPMSEQKSLLIGVEQAYRGKEKRRDDVSVIGFRV